MFKHTYDEMLEKAYKELPKLATSASRFDLPEIKGNVQGNKTFVKNFAQLATKLRRDMKHFLKFMLRELATTGDFDGTNVNFVGKFRDEFLTEKIEKYAKEFVLCSQCGKPDTNLKKERGLTFKTCEACGAKLAVRTLV